MITTVSKREMKQESGRVSVLPVADPCSSPIGQAHASLAHLRAIPTPSNELSKDHRHAAHVRRDKIRTAESGCTRQAGGFALMHLFDTNVVSGLRKARIGNVDA
jgi:hypothetical protein